MDKKTMVEGIAKVVSVEVMANKLRLGYLVNAATTAQVERLDEICRDAANLRSRAMDMLNSVDFSFKPEEIDEAASAEIRKEVKKATKMTARRIAKSILRLFANGVIGKCKDYFCDYEWECKLTDLADQLLEFAADFED